MVLTFTHCCMIFFSLILFSLRDVHKLNHHCLASLTSLVSSCFPKTAQIFHARVGTNALKYSDGWFLKSMSLCNCFLLEKWLFCSFLYASVLPFYTKSVDYLKIPLCCHHIIIVVPPPNGVTQPKKGQREETVTCTMRLQNWHT